VDTPQIERLQHTPIFGALRADTLEFLLAGTKRVEVGAGAYFFREGEPAEGMFVLESGRVVVLKGWQGAELAMRELDPGDCFGEMALLDLFPRSASIRALADSAAIELTATDLYRLSKHDLEQFALVQMNIGRELSRRLRATDELLFRARMGELTDSAPAPFRAI
jgi:CRP/FNR family cyclic AMP-dependent transcriptional regulator